MAGSYKHLVGADGEFTMDLIENMGDAHEALEDCFGIIRRAVLSEPTVEPDTVLRRCVMGLDKLCTTYSDIPSEYVRHFADAMRGELERIAEAKLGKCAGCGKEIQSYDGVVAYTEGTFCNRACFDALPAVLAAIEPSPEPELPHESYCALRTDPERGECDCRPEPSESAVEVARVLHDTLALITPCVACWEATAVKGAEKDPEECVWCDAIVQALVAFRAPAVQAERERAVEASIDRIGDFARHIREDYGAESDVGKAAKALSPTPEPTGESAGSCVGVYERGLTTKPPGSPDIGVCPRCGGPADMGFDRCLPPSPYECSKCDPPTPGGSKP